MFKSHNFFSRSAISSQLSSYLPNVFTLLVTAFLGIRAIWCFTRHTAFIHRPVWPWNLNYQRDWGISVYDPPGGGSGESVLPHVRYVSDRGNVLPYFLLSIQGFRLLTYYLIWLLGSNQKKIDQSNRNTRQLVVCLSVCLPVYLSVSLSIFGVSSVSLYTLIWSISFLDKFSLKNTFPSLTSLCFFFWEYLVF